MSNVADIYEKYISRVATLLPNYVRLSNPYKPEENPSLLLKQGYGVRIGAGLNVKKAYQPKVCISRTFEIVLTREYIAREDDGDAKASAEKQILADAAVLQKDITENFTLDGVVLLSKWTGDAGVQYVSVETDRFLKIVVSFEAQYFEEAS